MKIQSYDFAVMRRPLLSKDLLLEFHECVGNDQRKFESELKRIYADPVLQEALLLASLSVYEATIMLLETGTVSGKKKLLFTLYKYLIRMSTRCTPFGLFAGYFTVLLSDQTAITFSADQPIERHSRLDSRYLNAVRRRVLSSRWLKNQLPLFTNSSLYQAGENYRYMQRFDDDNSSTFVLKQAKRHPVFDLVLQAARNGLLPSQILAMLRHQKLSKASACSLLEMMSRTQLLTSSIEINVTGDDYLQSLIGTLQGLSGGRALAGRMTKIQKGFSDQPPLAQMQPALSVLGYNQNKPRVQTVMRLATQQASISRKTTHTICAQIEKIASLCKKPDNGDLNQFAKDLHARFGQQQIPLLLALDYDYGIGYGSLKAEIQSALPLLEGLDLARPSKTTKPFNPLAAAVYEKALTAQSQTTELTDTLLKKHANQSAPHLAESFYVLGSLIAANQQALDQKDFVFDLKALSGPSATNLLARLSQSDPDLKARIRQVIQQEQPYSPEVIHAEIAHLPALKAANILTRPLFTNYQIDYLGASGQPNLIRPDELTVSTPDGKNIILYSQQLQKQVIPTLTSAHNFTSGLPVYRFICDLANQSSTALYWDWAQCADSDFLPRITYKNLVLSKASWLISKAELKEQDDTALPLTVWWAKVQSRLKTPRYFTIGDHDHTLLIDSENQMALTLLRQALKKQGSLRITESLEQPGEGILHDQTQHFSSEIIIPCKSQSQSVAQPARQLQNPIDQMRDFALTSGWLYVKIYVSERLADELIRDTLAVFCQELISRKIIDKWFFVRYYDPRPHIRLRFYNQQNKGFWAVVLCELQQLLVPLLSNKTISGITTDIYQREIERYAPFCLNRIETLFYYDSQAVSRCLALIAQQSDLNLYWQLALKGTDKLLDDLGFELTEKSRLIESLHAQFAAERDPRGKLQIAIDQNYRAQKDRISRLLSNDSGAPVPGFVTILQKRSEQIRSLKPEYSIKDIAADLIHMHLNRCFNSHQRDQEFVIINI